GPVGEGAAVLAQRDPERDLFGWGVQDPHRTAQRRRRLGRLLLQRAQAGTHFGVELGFVAQPLDAGVQREQHGAHRVVQVYGEAAALLVYGDLGGVPGPVGDDVRGRHACGDGLQRAGGAVGEVGVLPVPAVQHSEDLALVDDRYADDRAQALRLGSGPEPWGDLVSGAVVAD